MIEDVLQQYLELLESELEVDPREGGAFALAAAAQILQLALRFAKDAGHSDEISIKLDPKTLAWITNQRAN